MDQTKSLSKVLKPEYRLALRFNAATTVDAFIKDYLNPNEHTEAFSQEWGHRYLGEMQPKTLHGPFWSTCVKMHALPEDLRYSMQYALNDKDFQNVLKQAKQEDHLRKYLVSNSNHVTAGLAAQLAIIQHLGIANRLAHKKKEHIGSFIGTLNDPENYKLVRKKIAMNFQAFLPYLPEEPYQFSLMAYERDIVKHVESAYRKVDDDKYNPVQHDPDREEDPDNPANDKPGSAGVFRIKDPLRITIVAKNSINPTWDEWIAQRNQIFAFAISGLLDIDLNEMKDHIVNAAEFTKKAKDNPNLSQDAALHWPCCMFHGKKISPIEDIDGTKEYVMLSQEIQFAPLNKTNKHYKDTTSELRYHARSAKKNAANNQIDEAHSLFIKDMWERTLPNLYGDVLDGRDDPSLQLITNYLKNDFKSNKDIILFDISGSGSFHQIDEKPDLGRAFAKLMKPYSAKAPSPH